MKKVISLALIAIICCVSFCGCGAKNEAATNEVTNETAAETETKAETKSEVKIETETEEIPAPEKLNVGDTVTSEDWKIKLTDAYTTDVLESDESRTTWEAEDGYSFLVLEMDVECLNSSKKTVDGDAITDLVATTVSENTYNDWEYQYIASELWCYFRNTYLDANLPVHAFIYTYVPTSVMNDKITVDLKLAGTDFELSVN